MSGRAPFLAFVIGLFASVAFGDAARAAECIGVQFPDSVKAGGSNLVLNGMGIRKATFVKVKVYVAGLYLPQKSVDAGQILGADQPWQLVLRFVHDVTASEISDSFNDGFKKSAGDKRAALRPRIDALNAMMKDFAKGQHLAFTNDPAKGVAVDVNSTGGGTIEGKDFAAALLAIWLGPEPPNAEIKSGMLGGACK
jgi:chalcone isomerase-like protein